MKRGPYNTLPRKLHANLLAFGPRKYAILEALARHWGYGAEDFHKAIDRLIDERKLKVLRHYGGVHYKAVA